MTDTPAAKRTRSATAATVATSTAPAQAAAAPPRLWFLVVVASGAESNAAFRAPLAADSVRVLKRAIRCVHDLQATSHRHHAAHFARAVVALLEGTDDDECLLLDYCLKDGRLDLRAAHAGSSRLPASFEPLDLRALATERALWEPFANGARWLQPDCAEDEPTDLYQVAMLSASLE